MLKVVSYFLAVKLVLLKWPLRPVERLIVHIHYLDRFVLGVIALVTPLKHLIQVVWWQVRNQVYVSGRWRINLSVHVTRECFRERIPCVWGRMLSFCLLVKRWASLSLKLWGRLRNSILLVLSLWISFDLNLNMSLSLINSTHSALSWQKVLSLRGLIDLLLRFLRAPEESWSTFFLIRWRFDTYHEVHFSLRRNDLLRLDPNAPVRLLWLGFDKSTSWGLSILIALARSLDATRLLPGKVLQGSPWALIIKLCNTFLLFIDHNIWGPLPLKKGIRTMWLEFRFRRFMGWIFRNYLFTNFELGNILFLQIQLSLWNDLVFQGLQVLPFQVWLRNFLSRHCFERQSNIPFVDGIRNFLSVRVVDYTSRA